MSEFYSKSVFTIEQRIKMLPIPSICEKCGKHTYTIEIVSEKQMNRDKKIKYLLK
jgi:hypothetical protein